MTDKRERVPPHPAMGHSHKLNDGSKLTITGMSKTQLAALLDGGKLPTDRPVEVSEAVKSGGKIAGE